MVDFSEKYLAGYPVPNFPVVGKWRDWARNLEHETLASSLVIDLPDYQGFPIAVSKPVFLPHHDCDNMEDCCIDK